MGISRASSSGAWWVLRCWLPLQPWPCAAGHNGEAPAASRCAPAALLLWLPGLHLHLLLQPFHLQHTQRQSAGTLMAAPALPLLHLPNVSVLTFQPSYSCSLLKHRR